MKVKFVSKLNKMSEIVFLVLSKKSELKKTGLSDKHIKEITKSIENKGFGFKLNEIIEINGIKDSKLKTVYICGLGNKTKDINALDYEKIGGKITELTKLKTKASVIIDKEVNNNENIMRLGYGSILGSYSFNKYKTKNIINHKISLIEIVSNNHTKLNKDFKRYTSISDGVFYARDLVNEPSNVLFPKAYAQRIQKLRQHGLKIEVLGESKMKILKMHSLVGVGQGSQRESQLVIMHWNGAKAKKNKPICFVGKGVCFDSGGISIKPSNKMEEMIGDMGGSAAVVGTMLSLAKRKAKVNAIGIVGLVENMPDGKAQKPGDIIKSMSGQTIEIQNTDAEGRLVLADALWYAQKRFKPELMIDLATLTGAMVISLGSLIAGLFSNDDKLSSKLIDAGEDSGDQVWRFPLSKSYDKLINSKFADMKNIGMGGAGSITAAQFLQRFVNKVPWAHLDIAGTATGMPKTSTNTSWATGFGVHLLDTFVKKFYEK
ncbi:MAG: leucyl aminopeptidase [Rhodobiaceae bacterium]|nr:leucyl aminopeptidase [Rhodobiaceae bacterium]